MHLGTRLCVPDVDELRKEIMEEAHFSAYSIHPGSTKMYHDLKRYLLVEWDEKSYCIICIQMSHLPISEIRTSEAFRIIVTVAHSKVEVGYDCYGFYD